jgi:DNA-binding MarR family transcriptional regulator
VPTTETVNDLLVEVLDAVLYLDRKQIVASGGVRLHPSEAHVLACLVQGMEFAEIARHFAISKSAVSQALTRLTARGVITVSGAGRRRTAASVALTPLGQELLAQIVVLRSTLRSALEARLAGYSPHDLAVVERFVTDLRAHVREALIGSSPSPGPAVEGTAP